jgi:HEAT repeat protein
MRPRSFVALLAALIGCALALPPALAQGSGGDEPPRSVRILLQMLEEQGSQTTPAAYEVLEQSGHPAAFEGLAQRLREPLTPLLMRIRATRHLAGFASQPALADAVREVLVDEALGAREPGLRRLAIEELFEIGRTSASSIELVVDHSDDGALRARALELHVQLEPDEAWYLSLLTGEGRVLRDDRLDRDLVPVDERLARAAFDAVAQTLTDEALLGLLSSPDLELRIDSLGELVRREHPDAAAKTLERYRTTAAPLRERLTAGAMHVRYAEDEFVAELIGAASAPDVDRATAEQVGQTVAPYLTIRLRGDLQRAVQSGSVGERVVAATALRGDRSTRFRKNLDRLLEDDDPALRRLAIEELAAWIGDEDALEGLLDRLEDDELELGEGGAVLRSATAVAGELAGWDERLASYLEHPAADVRGEALRLLAGRAGDRAVALLAANLASDDWTRVGVAVELLLDDRGPGAVEALVEAVATLSGRDQRAVADGLWRLTGMEYGTRAPAWRDWWERLGSGFEPLDRLETELLLEAQQVEDGGTTATVSAIRVESRRVCFVIDVSGSMKELTSWGRLDKDDGGVPRDTRIDVVRAELAGALDSLSDGAEFNVLLFSDDVERWSNGLEPAGESSLRKAKAFVARQAPSGGTNLHAALREAFSDQRVDSIVLFSDGEPSMGEVRDSDELLETLERWNTGRGMRIDCVAIGVRLQLLERMAERFGGRCVSLR